MISFSYLYLKLFRWPPPVHQPQFITHYKSEHNSNSNSYLKRLCQMGPLAFSRSHCHHVSLCHGSLTDLGNCLSNVLSQILSQDTCFWSGRFLSDPGVIGVCSSFKLQFKCHFYEDAVLALCTEAASHLGHAFSSSTRWYSVLSTFYFLKVIWLIDSFVCWLVYFMSFPPDGKLSGDRGVV